ncbi:MAG: immunoglobulin domain-containing protein, partial [Janthinobacterium lividum]
MRKTMTRAVSVLGVVAVLASCGGGGGGSSSNPPAISTQPQAQVTVTGGTVTLAVAATGNNLSYQWRRNDVAIAGATAASYTTPALSYLDIGASYTVSVSNNDGTVTSTPVTLSLALSADQKIFEDLILSGGGSYSTNTNLKAAGTQVNGVNYASSTSALLLKSPLTNGPQTFTQSAKSNLTASLPLVARAPPWTLKNGVILTTPETGFSATISYVGSAIQVDQLAADGSTVAFSELRSGYSTAALSGALGATPALVTDYLYSLFQNPLVLDTSRSYLANASYIKYVGVSKGDRYQIFDCYGTTTTTNPLPCYTSQTLESVLTAGATSVSDGLTYTLGNGSISTVGGVRVWVAATARPPSSTLRSTLEYRTFTEIGGNVYTGAVIRDGSALGEVGYYNTANVLVTVPYSIRLNKAARDS